ncbi:DUF3570 domain-containing protein [Flaviaesturariibacter flavus]|uniref:DUF3570 domain-containing protein n=1 Tax=Flaviaesturariibacter flavus TaxID=2502780 RepID=A0A4V2NWZ9_9BACT|nr:DUF3570 domain-containing protein [Flaviaesturariibacter flavus]TCJ19342.1 DUF3570 domain-containing protein [Flaviaesturariibacter flavus]
MKKIYLNVLALYVGMLSAAAQQTAVSDSSAYRPRKLSITEINLVSAYYTQDGDNSAVTGGIGTEQLTDISNTIDIKWVRYDRNNREHNLVAEIGVDHYTSASSDMIDPATLSSASHADTRIYPSLNYTVKNPVRGHTLGGSVSFSKEYDYTSLGVGLQGSKSSADNNREFGLHLQAYFDQWKVILPVELRRRGEAVEGYSPRRTYSASFSYSQVINPRLQAVLLLDLVGQEGLLATRYQRVYFKNGSESAEQLPSSRFKLPIGARLHYFAGDRFIFRGSYRFYTDDWGIRAHTAELEVPVKLTPYLSVSPFYRYYTQTAADYFAPFAAQDPAATLFTSDYDLAALHSQFFGSGIRFLPEKGVLGMKHWNMLELRYGHYLRSNGLHSDIISMNLRFR